MDDGKAPETGGMGIAHIVLVTANPTAGEDFEA
jgi:hypothetical protein